MKKEELIMAKLNVLTILDFYNNYNKSEYERFFTEETEEQKKLKNEIKEIMYSIYDEKEYEINVSDNMIIINKIMEKTDTSTTLQVKEKIFSTNFEKLPYNYIMGKKVSKKIMQETMKKFA